MIRRNDLSLDQETLELFFKKDPYVIPLYASIEKTLLDEHPDLQVRCDKTQITFLSKHPMASIWLPLRKVKGRPEHYLVLSIALNRRIDDPRSLEVVEPYPNRWMHHFLIESQNQIDQSLMDVFDEAYRFSTR